MRSLSLFSLTFALLFSASSAEAYFRVLPSEEAVPPVRAPAMAVHDWPEWLGVPQWMYTQSPIATIPPVIVRTGTQSTENWPLWIDQPNWLK